MRSTPSCSSPAIAVGQIGLVVAAGLLMIGCGKHYWSRAGADAGEFQTESAECVRENAMQLSTSNDYGIVIADLYKACMKARGWNRAQQFEPPPPGWFQGIEEDGLMRLTPPPPAPPPTPQPTRQ